jgi:hypothetical protein
MLYNSMLHNTLMYVTPCYITCACYVSCYITCSTLLLRIVAGRDTRMLVLPPSPEASESEHGGGSTGVPEWQLLDWDDYDFPEGAAGAGGGGGSATDPIATMLDGLPDFIAEDIAALLHDLPLPAAGDTPGMTVDEAIQVFHGIQPYYRYQII